KSMRRTMVTRIYRLSAVTPPCEVPGSLRPASMDDVDLVTAWAVAFAGDTGATLGDVRPGIVHRIAARHIFLWELSGRPVALTVRGPAVGGIVRVSLVYTPPELRRRGYATACVANVSRLALDDGARGCMLYADLANAMTNAIYQRLGYAPGGDAADYRFDGWSGTLTPAPLSERASSESTPERARPQCPCPPGGSRRARPQRDLARLDVAEAVGRHGEDHDDLMLAGVA